MTDLSAFDIGLARPDPGNRGFDDRRAQGVHGCIAFVVYGLLLAIAWVRLNAIDVALTEAAIGGGMTGMLMLGAVARLRHAKATTSGPACPPVLWREYCARWSRQASQPPYCHHPKPFRHSRRR